MKNLKEHFHANRALYEQDEPDDGHLERFINRLDVSQSPTSKNSFKIRFWQMAVAASLLVALFVVPLYFWKNKPEPLSEPLTSITDLSTIRDFYTTQTGNYMHQLEMLANKGLVDPAERQDALKRVDELLAKNMTLSMQYERLGGDERLKKAMIRNYRMMSESLSQLIHFSRNTHNFIPEKS